MFVPMWAIVVVCLLEGANFVLSVMDYYKRR